MFRPRFRLSLLFVLAALVAGVSVWLRQAVVRDRNIREFISEEFVGGGGVDEEEYFLNTKILNFFCSEDRYYDRLLNLQLSIHKINIPAALQKYQDCDLGSDLDVLFIHAWPLDEMDTDIERKIPPIALSQIQCWTNSFKKINKLIIEGGDIVNDVGETLPCRVKVLKLNIRMTTIDVESFRKLIQALKIAPQDLEFNSNNVNSKFSSFRELGIFDKEQLEYLDTHNSFTVHGYSEAK